MPDHFQRTPPEHLPAEVADLLSRQRHRRTARHEVWREHRNWAKSLPTSYEQLLMSSVASASIVTQVASKFDPRNAKSILRSVGNAPSETGKWAIF